MNFGDSQDYVAGFLDDINYGYYTRDQIKTWLNWGQREVQRLLLQAGQNYYLICKKMTAVVGQPDYGLPDAFLKTHEMRVITGGTYPNETYITCAPMTVMQAGAVNQQNGTPAGYVLSKNKFYFDRPPDRAYVCKLRFSYLVADCVQDAEVFDVPDQYLDLVPLLAIKYGFLRDKRKIDEVDEKVKSLALQIRQDANNRQVDAPRRVKRVTWGGSIF